jgi:hypothetical protein
MEPLDKRQRTGEEEIPDEDLKMKVATAPVIEEAIMDGAKLFPAGQQLMGVVH